MTLDNTDREQGVDFTDLNPVLEDISYPITADELVAQYGDHALERTNAELIAILELLGQSGNDTFEPLNEGRQSILNLMPRESAGREECSDRGVSHPEATEEVDNLEEEKSL